MKISKKILEKNPLFIAEVGQNHQGSFKLACKYVEVFSKLGANIIKFQMRDNKGLFSKEAFEKEYSTKNSFGKTYGVHRNKLELSIVEIKKLKNFCKKNKVEIMVTPFDEVSFNKLCKIGVNLIKISSFDLGNLPLIKTIAQKKKKIFMSVGGGDDKEIDSSIKLANKYGIKPIILHCVSEYPCPADNLGLSRIKYLLKKYPGHIIGSSDHFAGILSGPVAYLEGARVFEKHVTFDRTWKGTDHNFSLEPEGFRKFVRDTKRVGLMLKPKSQKKIGKEYVFQKLGKSIISKKLIKKGEKIKLDFLTGKIFFEQFIPIRQTHKILGKIAKKNILKNQPITLKDIR